MIRLTNEQFAGIGNTINRLNENVYNINDRIEEIVESNNVIVDSINQISAVSEEVSASALQAVELGESTSKDANNTKVLMEELLVAVNGIDKYVQE